MITTKYTERRSARVQVSVSRPSDLGQRPETPRERRPANVLITVGAIWTTFIIAMGISFGQFDRVRYPKENLPDYCKYTLDGAGHPVKTPEYELRLGKEYFQHVHHYCRGLWNIDEAVSKWDDDMARRFHFDNSVNEFNYVLRNTGEDFILRPEILVKKGDSQLALGRNMEAVESYTEALRLSPKYVPAYVALGNFFLDSGDTEGARMIYESGLAIVPDSEILAQKVSEAGLN